MAALDAKLGATRYELVVIDTLTEAFPTENMSRDVVRSDYRPNQFADEVGQ